MNYYAKLLGRLKVLSVRFLCFLSLSAKLNFFHNSDFFLLPSNTENIPLVSLLYLIFHLSAIPFLFSPFTANSPPFSYQVIYL